PPQEAMEGIAVDCVSEWKPAYVSVYYPRTENEQADKAVQAFVDGKLAQFKQGARPGAKDGGELTVSLKVTRFDDDIVSFLFRSYTRCAGEAGGRDELDTMTFDLSTGERYELASLFRGGGDYLKALSRLVYDELQSLAFYRASEPESALLRKGTQASAENFREFALDGDTLRLFFPPAQLGSGPNAADRCDIPLAALKSLLARRFLLPRRGGVEPPEPDPLKPEDLEGQKLIALTFDDGPHRVNTPRLLDILEAEGVRVTFFVLGCNAETLPDIPRRAADGGHQVASHTWHHKDLTKLGAAQRRAEIEDTAALLEHITGLRPTAMRPPYGAQNEAVRAAADTPLILWSIDPVDWKTRDADKTYAHVMAHVRDGDIILLHDIHAPTIDAAEKLIPALKAQGYIFVTVDQLLAARGGAAPGEVVMKRPGEPEE
ncbi:MAG: polysaccharide deacetylase family protein, partial [Oscillospiraceae bacterium]|nr:polysaccharide deacetylase family protein [Oscillospiraceae bacterium]